MTMPEVPELIALPAPGVSVLGCVNKNAPMNYVYAYTADQMRAYGQQCANAASLRGGWIAVSDRLPDREDVVWCHRKWTPTHPGSDGLPRTHIRLARRNSDRALTLHEDSSRNDYWIGLGVDAGKSWSDSTVTHWMPSTPPKSTPTDKDNTP